MATNTRQEVIQEARATAEASAIIRTIDDLTRDPSGKRFAKQRSTRIEAWIRLVSLASCQISALQALSEPKPTVVHKPDPIPEDRAAGFIEDQTARLITHP